MESQEKRQGLSFGFSKKKDTKVVKSDVLLQEKDIVVDEKEAVTSIEERNIQGTKPKADKRQYVIPMIKANNWRVKTDKNKENLTEEESQAVKEILEETARLNQNWEERDATKSTLAIPLLLRNQVPQGYENDDKLDVSLRPDETATADYDQMPIEQFGMAMLRGMGWKDGEGIGKNKKKIAPIEAKLRPKGLGLGADRSKLPGLVDPVNGDSSKNSKTQNGKEDELSFKAGAFCVVKKGPHTDLYGKIDGIDEDNARVVVKMAVSGEIITISQYNVQLVIKDDYNKNSKYLNKGKADRYKEEQMKKNTEKDSERASKKNSHESREKEDKKSSSSKKKRKHEDSRVESNKEHNGSQEDFIWLRPQLRVRIVDKHYKKGKYYNTKVEIIDVLSRSAQTCVCRTDNGKVLEEISQSMLETVIPKSEQSHVMIMAGKHRGLLGEVIEKDKSKYRAIVQLLSDRDSVVKLEYDEICEYIGDIEADMDF